MRVSIDPVSAVPERLLREHLLRYGLPSDIIEWKYFDRGFSPGRERGYAWVRDGHVQGIIGMIPFRLRRAGELTDCAWTCDWFVESPTRNPGVGVVLLKSAVERAGLLVTVGGNEATRRLVPRLAVSTIEDAALELHLPLRLGGTALYRKLEARVPLPLSRPFRGLPLRPRPARLPARGHQVTTEAGVSSAIGNLTEEASSDGWGPSYDLGYVDWQIGRCPAVTCATCYGPSKPPAAASVFWTPRAGGGAWRMVLWTRAGADDHGGAVLDQTIREVERHHGDVISTIVSRRDRTSTTLLTGAGFRPTGRSFPFYVLATGNAARPSELSRHSYLDSDLAHRF